MLSKYSTNKEYFNKTKEELLFAFSGRMGFELFLFWDKVLTYFILNDNSDVFCEFIQKMLNNIKRITYKNKNALKKIQKELINYLKESVYLSLSLKGVYQILMKLQKFRNMKWDLSDSENTISYFRQILPSKYTIS